MNLTRENILGRNLPALSIEVPEWGGIIYIRKLSIAAIKKLKGESANVSAVRWLILCVVDEHGNPLFSDDDTEQLESASSYETCMQVIKAAMEYNGLSTRSIEEVSGN